MVHGGTDDDSILFVLSPPSPLLAAFYVLASLPRADRRDAGADAVNREERDRLDREQPWLVLWRMFARKHGERTEAFSETKAWLHCRVCGKFAEKRIFKGDAMRRRQWETYHRVGCPRRVVLMLPPAARIVASWSEHDRSLEIELIAQLAYNDQAAAVLADFYLEHNLVVMMKRALRAAGYRYGVDGKTRQAQADLEQRLKETRAQQAEMEAQLEQMRRAVSR